MTHFRNVKTVNWKDSSKERALVNLGGGPRPMPKTEKGVPVYLHDWFGPGRHARWSSACARASSRRTPTSSRRTSPLTGDESRVAEVKDVAFPKLLDPVDDLPPTTVITHVHKQSTARWWSAARRRTTAPSSGCVVNGHEAKALTPNFAEWEVTLDRDAAGPMKLEAAAEDAAGNVEKRPHVVIVGN